MDEYRGFIALIPRQTVGRWIQDHVVGPAIPVLQAFASDAAWQEDQLKLPALGRRLEFRGGALIYTARQYTAQNGERNGDTLALACSYANVWHAPGGKFAADVELRQHHGARLIMMTAEDLDTQIARALANT